MRRGALMMVLGLLLAGQAADAGEDAVPRVLDPDRRSAHSTHQEVFAYSGFYFGDLLDNSYVAGLDYLVRFDQTWALGPSFTYTRAALANSDRLNQAGFFDSRHMFTLNLTLMIILPAAFLTGDSAVQAELYSIFGLGTIAIDDKWQPHGFIGGGMKIFPGLDWLAIRVDLRTGMHGIDTPSGAVFDQDLSLMLGLALPIPPHIET